MSLKMANSGQSCPGMTNPWVESQPKNPGRNIRRQPFVTISKFIFGVLLKIGKSITISSPKMNKKQFIQIKKQSSKIPFVQTFYLLEYKFW